MGDNINNFTFLMFLKYRSCLNAQIDKDTTVYEKLAGVIQKCKAVQQKDIYLFRNKIVCSVFNCKCCGLFFKTTTFVILTQFHVKI